MRCCYCCGGGGGCCGGGDGCDGEGGEMTGEGDGVVGLDRVGRGSTHCHTWQSCVGVTVPLVCGVLLWLRW